MELWYALGGAVSGAILGFIAVKFLDRLRMKDVETEAERIKTDAERVAFLFELYQQYTGLPLADNKEPKKKSWQKRRRERAL